jgi:hypothetical protein
MIARHAGVGDGETPARAAVSLRARGKRQIVARRSGGLGVSTDTMADVPHVGLAGFEAGQFEDHRGRLSTGSRSDVGVAADGGVAGRSEGGTPVGGYGEGRWNRGDVARARGGHTGVGRVMGAGGGDRRDCNAQRDGAKRQQEKREGGGRRRRRRERRRRELVQLLGSLLLSGFVRVTLLIRREGCRDVWYSTLAGAFRCHRLLLSSALCSAIDFPMRSLSRSIRQSRSRWEFQDWAGRFREEGFHAGD